jgi:hypothetical protein
LTTRDDFTPDEWAAVIQAALAPAFMMAVTVDFNLFALPKKLEAFKEVVELSRRRSSSFLMHDIIKQVDMQRQSGENHPDSNWQLDQTQGESMRSGLPGMLRKALEILSLKASQQEIGEYRAFILDTTEAVSRASHSKGLFATQGNLVSENEDEFMNIVRTSLGR